MAINTLAVVQQNGLSIDEYWQKRLLGIIAIEREEMPFQSLGVEKVIPLHQGTKVFTMRRYNRLPVNLVDMLLAEGVAPEALKVEGQKVSGTVNQYGALIKETDVEEAIHFDNIKKKVDEKRFTSGQPQKTTLTIDDLVDQDLAELRKRKGRA